MPRGFRSFLGKGIVRVFRKCLMRQIGIPGAIRNHYLNNGIFPEEGWHEKFALFLQRPGDHDTGVVPDFLEIVGEG